MVIPYNSSYLTEAEARQKLLEIELKYDLFKYEFDGYSAWRLLRFEAMSSLQNLPFLSKAAKLSVPSRLIEKLSMMCQELPALLFPKRAKYIVKTFTSALREKEMGFFKDIYFDDLVRDLGSCFKIEGLNNPVYNDRRKKMLFPVEITTATIDLLASLMSRLVGPKSITVISAKLSEALHSEPLLQYFSRSKIRNRLRWFYWSKRIYSRLLRKIKPTYVLTADTGEFAIWAAAQELGIITVEFQHGIFSQNHPDALPGYALRYRDSLIVPDKLLVYGQYWMDELQKNRFYDRELIPVGNHRIDYYRQVRSEKILSIEGSGYCTILITTQGLDRDRLIDFVARFLLIVQSKLKCQVLIKLHPTESDKNVYEHCLSAFSNVNVFLANEEPTTFDLLTRAHYHCSIASATHYEALGIGVPTIVLPLAGHEIVDGLVSAGHALFVGNPQELADVVFNFRNIVVPFEVREYYFSPNALQNIKNQIG